MNDTPWHLFCWYLFWAVMGIALLVTFAIISLDKAEQGMYNDLHPHMCFERLVKEPWEVEPLGRIEQVGVKRILVVMGQDRKPLAALDAYAYGFTMLKADFHREYKEAPCQSSK